MDDTTKTGRRATSRENSVVSLWTLRALYMGTTGIVNSAAKVWDASSPLNMGRRISSFRLGTWLQLDDERVSREHAQLLADGKTILIKDLVSKNGTEVNGRRLGPGESLPLGDGDLIRVGDSLVILRYEPVQPPDAPIPSLVGISASMCKLRQAIARCAGQDKPVLILGETGTGKGVVAQAIHRESGRSGNFVAVNCAAIPATLAESMLFGVQKGAFTGAAPQSGFFGEANRGTLFLDEIGDLPAELQPKLLHSLETREVIPLGSSRPVACDVRIVAATNRDLSLAIGKQTFREDLYARLTASPLRLPPLRDRCEDILLLAQHIAGVDFHLSPRLAETLLRYSWPGNVRELGNILGQIRDTSEDEVIQGLSSHRPVPLPPAEQPPARPWKAGDPSPSRRQIVKLLEEYAGNLRRIERETGYSRRQFGRFAAEHGIDIQQYRQQK